MKPCSFCAAFREKMREFKENGILFLTNYYFIIQHCRIIIYKKNTLVTRHWVLEKYCDFGLFSYIFLKIQHKCKKLFGAKTRKGEIQYVGWVTK